MNIVKRLYDWMLSWGDSKWGGMALFLFALAESTFFPVPPDILLIALCLGASAKAFKYAAVCLGGSVTGALLGYAIGFFLWQTPSGEFTGLANFFFDHVFSIEGFQRVAALYDQYNFWIVFTAGFTPLPYKLFTISAGLFHIDLAMFLLASVVSRGLRFFLISGLIWKFGAPIKSFIDKYFNLLAILFTILLVGSFFLVGKLAQ